MNNRKDAISNIKIMIVTEVIICGYMTLLLIIKINKKIIPV